MKSVPCVMMMPSIVLSLRYGSHVSANVFQSWKDMFSENFMKGETISVMLQISLIWGAMFRMSSLSVDITAPDFGSRRDEIVPPVTIITMFLSFLFWDGILDTGDGVDGFFRIVASRIWFSLIPML